MEEIDTYQQKIKEMKSDLEDKDRSIRKFMTEQNENRNKTLALQTCQLDNEETIEKLKEESKAHKLKLTSY